MYSVALEQCYLALVFCRIFPRARMKQGAFRCVCPRLTLLLASNGLASSGHPSGTPADHDANQLKSEMRNSRVVLESI